MTNFVSPNPVLHDGTWNGNAAARTFAAIDAPGLAWLGNSGLYNRTDGRSGVNEIHMWGRFMSLTAHSDRWRRNGRLGIEEAMVAEQISSVSFTSNLWDCSLPKAKRKDGAYFDRFS